jgi:hypothetical protein
VVYLMCLEFRKTSARTWLIIAGAAFIIAMGLSRVFLGHHWLTDDRGGLGGCGDPGPQALPCHPPAGARRPRPHVRAPGPSEGRQSRAGGAPPGVSRCRRRSRKPGRGAKPRVIVLTHAHTRRGPSAGRPQAHRPAG